MPRSGPRTTYKYSYKFKATAVKLKELPGVRSKDVADSLCIHPFMRANYRETGILGGFTDYGGRFQYVACLFCKIQRLPVYAMK